MSDETPEPPKPPGKPTTKTSTVPLKKETVRITLRAKPGAEGAPPAPAGGPPAPKPPAPAPTPPAAPPAPAPPAPPAAGAPPAPAPPAPGAPPAPAPPTGAKTVPLTPAPPAAAPGAPAAPVAQPTAKLQPAGAPPAAPGAPGTRPLPKATVKLQPTQPVSSAPGAAVTSAPSSGRLSAELEDDEETGILPFAAIAAVLALVAFAVEFLGSDRFIKQDANGSPAFAVPAAKFEGNKKAYKYEDVSRTTGEVKLTRRFPEEARNGVLKIETYEDYKAENQ